MIKSSSFSVRSRGDCDITDITPQVSTELIASGMKNGNVNIFVSGSTAGVTTIEFEPGLVSDLKRAFEKIAPKNIEYEHNKKWGDGNGHAHVRASLLGASLVVPVIHGQMALGTWQQIVLVDFDNRPRTREIVVQFTGE